MPCLLQPTTVCFGSYGMVLEYVLAGASEEREEKTMPQSFTTACHGQTKQPEVTPLPNLMQTL